MTIPFYRGKPVFVNGKFSLDFDCCPQPACCGNCFFPMSGDLCDDPTQTGENGGPTQITNFYHYSERAESPFNDDNTVVTEISQSGPSFHLGICGDECIINEEGEEEIVLLPTSECAFVVPVTGAAGDNVFISYTGTSWQIVEGSSQFFGWNPSGGNGVVESSTESCSGASQTGTLFYPFSSETIIEAPYQTSFDVVGARTCSNRG